MAPLSLSRASVLRLFGIVNEQLRSAALPAPAARESEEKYTDRCVLPVVRSVVERTRISHLLVGGHHTGINRPVRYLGFDFHPDVLVIYRGQRLLAYEVKFLAGGDASGALSKAIGQASIYGMHGYSASAALILDVSGARSPSQIARAANAEGPSRFAVIARTIHRDNFRVGATAYAPE